MRRVLAIFLDGYEHSLGQRLISAGEMPEMSRLAASSARFLLDHGEAQRTGLAGEHVATGLSPEATRRWSAACFDPRSYAVWQEGTRLRPFMADLKCRSVVFDAPYFNLKAAPAVRGLVNWGAHDPGVAPVSRPSGLLTEINDRFGSYPAARWIYGFAWPSPSRSREMGADLARAVEVRADLAHWLLSDRFPDWELALVATGELHSAIEGLWHGIDSTHPLNRHPAAEQADAGVRAVYHAIDRLIGKLTSAFPDALTVVFTMGGMGPNRSDVPSMLLLPELMYRHAFGSALFRQPPEWDLSVGVCPILPPETEDWERCILAKFPAPPEQYNSTPPGSRSRNVVAKVLPKRVKAFLRQRLGNSPTHSSLAWMPATKYQPYWHAMSAFALPSFYDGSIRLNLIGRERDGIVKPGEYGRVLGSVEALVRECIDPATGTSAVDFVRYPAPKDPQELTSTQSDLVVVWKGTPVCLEHPSLGRIGPVPYRRTGGHTGPFGMAYVRSDGVPIGDHGVRSAFDVAPTIIALTGSPQRRSLSGKSLSSGLQIRDEGRAHRASSFADHEP